MLHIVVRTLFNSEFYVNKKLSIKGNLQITLIVNIPYMMDKYQAINYKNNEHNDHHCFSYFIYILN